jgi:hypothetical protein
MVWGPSRSLLTWIVSLTVREPRVGHRAMYEVRIGPIRRFENGVSFYPQVKILGNAYSSRPDRLNPLDPVPRVSIGPSRAGNFPYLHLRAEMTLHFSENCDYWFDSCLGMCPLSFLWRHVLLFIAIIDIMCHKASNAMICCWTTPMDPYWLKNAFVTSAVIHEHLYYIRFSCKFLFPLNNISYMISTIPYLSIRNGSI